MAEVENQSGGEQNKHNRKPRQKKKSTKIDMTAMVDVAFLLLTFFILTTTMVEHKAMNFNLPVDDGKNVAQSKVLTLILGADDKVHYYAGLPESGIHTTTYASTGIRRVISDHLNKFANRCDEVDDKSDCWDPIVVIKPNKSCRYANMVDAMDEMAILKVPKYAMGKVEEPDSLLLADNNLR
jgi:biopolymer transport protein ExbD